ncbi:MAG: HAD family hydrolase [Pontibacterium sp.]
MIKCITFDLDDTLWAVHPVVKRANYSLFEWLSQNASAFTRLYSVHDLARLRTEVLAQYPEIAHSVTQIRLKVLEQGLLAAGYTQAEAEVLALEAFKVFLEARQQVSFFEHAMVMIKNLHAQGYRIGALSNGNADIHRVGLGDYFDFQFSADQVGQEKPHPLMFEQMLHHVKLRPEQVIHIGDNPVHDIEGAANLGLWTIWVNLNGDKHAAQATRTVHCLSDIPQAVAEINELAKNRLTI